MTTSDHSRDQEGRKRWRADVTFKDVLLAADKLKQKDYEGWVAFFAEHDMDVHDWVFFPESSRVDWKFVTRHMLYTPPNVKFIHDTIMGPNVQMVIMAREMYAETHFEPLKEIPTQFKTNFYGGRVGEQ